MVLAPVKNRFAVDRALRGRGMHAAGRSISLHRIPSVLRKRIYTTCKDWGHKARPFLPEPTRQENQAGYSESHHKGGAAEAGAGFLPAGLQKVDALAAIAVCAPGRSARG